MQTSHKKILIPILIIAISLCTATILRNRDTVPKVTEKKRSKPLVNVAIVEKQNLHFTIDSYGIVKPKHSSKLVAEVSGRIIKLDQRFVAGSFVNVGDVLIRLEASDYEANLKQAEAGLARAQATFEEELARNKVAEQEWKEVFKHGIAPQLGLRKPQLKHEQANVKSAEAALAKARRNLQRTIIRAPYAALIKEKSIDLGQYVSIGMNLGTVYDTRQAEIRLPITEQEYAFLQNQTPYPVTIYSSTYQSETGEQAYRQGNIVRNEGIIDENNRMIYLVAQLTDPYQLSSTIDKTLKLTDQNPVLNNHKQNMSLKYGSFVTAKIQGKVVNEVVLLPRHLLHNNMVTLVNKDNMLQSIPVNVIRTDNEFAYIDEGLQEGDQILLTVVNNTMSKHEVLISKRLPLSKLHILNNRD